MISQMMKTQEFKFYEVLAVEVNFKILQSKPVESGWKNYYKCVFQQGVVFLTIFPLKYPWAFRNEGLTSYLYMD
jgi:hypothetical protein